MASLSRNCSFRQFLAWAFVVAFITLPIVFIASLPGLFLMSSPAGATLPGAVFFLSEGSAIVVTFTIGLPVAMLLGSALVGKLNGIADSDLPDRSTTARYFHKLRFQLTRMAIVMMIILVPAWILIPDTSKLWVTLKVVIPCLGPVVLAITGAYYFSNRLKKSVNS
jgi:hypothetical protein